MTTQASMDSRIERSLDSSVTVMGFGRRLVPALFDGLFIGVLGFVVLIVVGMTCVIFGWMEDTESVGFQALSFACGIVLSLAYYVGAWTNSGQTGGMTLGGIRVVSVTGAVPSLWQSLVRYLGYYISAIPLGLGFLWIDFDKLRQGWHDRLAKTYVIEDDIAFSSDYPPEFKPSDPGRGWMWAVAWLAVALFLPGGLLASFWLAGPIVVRLMANAFGVGD